ncbi:ras-related protein Rab-34 [Frankliniella occidentalis]|uniref:Ras-related protein Rab-36 n=1 Tax=Frankliniella occidentalis TaxID=133901 RepID=A0A9C6U9G6_FRAOC|nr:ras-related protein Rab-34 [Frankliniella occidentalis]
MLPSRSVVLKMMQSQACVEHRIDDFPKPFSHQFTPHKQNDFSFAVREICSSTGKFIPGLKISKVIFLGDVAAGKTSLVNRFCHKVFSSNYKATIGVDFEVERFDILKIPFNLQIWDTAGQERFKCIASSYYRGAQVIGVIFDLSNIYSLSNCAKWLEEALACNALRPIIFLIGTKSDLLSSSAYKHVEKLATQVAQQLGAEYWAVSSRTGDGVNELFLRIAALAFEVSVLRDLHTAGIKLSIGTELVCKYNLPI